MELRSLDFLVIIIYFGFILSVAIRFARAPKDHHRNTEDYFLASRALPWWIIGASLIAANISTEQLIGMNGSAFVSGIAIISYSWIGACIPQLIVAKFFLPTFLKMKIYSMPQYLERRYDRRVSTGMGVFWLLVYVFVNLTSVLYLGALSLQTMLGVPLIYGIILLSVLAGIFTVYGGLSPVAWTDFIQVSVLVAGGLAVLYFGLCQISDGKGALEGLIKLMDQVPEKFHTVLEASHPDLPWPGVFMGGLWIAALSYWGCNQYIIQKALAAKSLREAQYGLIFASFLSLIVSAIIVLPGIVASVLYSDSIRKADEAYPTLIRELIPHGWTGLIIAALVAAIVSSLNSMTNSASTIFTMDIYRPLVKREVSQEHLVFVGRVASCGVLVVAASIAPKLTNLGQAFQFIQEYTGFVTPGVMAIFLFGLFWRRTTSIAALSAAMGTIPVSALLKVLLPGMGFLNRMGLTFALLCALIVAITLAYRSDDRTHQRLVLESSESRTPLLFNVLAIAMMGLIGALYLYFW
jgi:SSS family solute:Na+ symporter